MSPTSILILSAVLIAWAPILVKGVEAGPSGIGFFRCLFAAVILLVFSLVRKPLRSELSQIFHLSKRTWLLVVGAGFFFALDLAAWHRSVHYAGAGLGTILANTQVFYLGLLGIFFFKDRLGLNYYLAVPFAFAGIYMVAQPDPTFQIHPQYWEGVFLGIIAGLFYSSFMICLRFLDEQKDAPPILVRVFLFSVSGAAVLGPLSFFQNEALPQAANDYAGLIGLALLPQILGWSLIARSLPQIPLSRAGLILLIQPVGATLLGALIFNENLSQLQICGAFLTLTAVYVGSLRPRS